MYSKLSFKAVNSFFVKFFVDRQNGSEMFKWYQVLVQ